MMDFTNDQKRVIEARNSDLLVSAAAGSGKTAVLVERVIQMLSDSEHPIDVDNLLVVTFTKAAASQMKDKIAEALEKKLQEMPDDTHLIDQLNYIDCANILTIDSFCYRLVKEHFYKLGIDPGIRIGSGGEMGILRHEVLEKVIEDFYGTNSDFVDFSDAFSDDKNDDKIEEYIGKIYDVSSSYPQPLAWTKEARKELTPENLKEFCEISYVKDYLVEVKGSLQGIKDRIEFAITRAQKPDGPVHMVKTFNSDIAVIDGLLAAEDYAQLAALSKVEFVRLASGKKGTFDEDAAGKLNKERNKWKDDIKKLMSIFATSIDAVIEKMNAQSKMLIALLDAVDAFRDEYMKAKLERNILEYSDVEHLALQVLCDGYDDAGLPIPSSVAKELSAQFEEILIDEYQDSNFLQEAILGCVSKHHMGRHNIFMVGDVKQSIYGFRMARPDLFMEKYHTYKDNDDAQCRKLLLKNNFRSRANVLESINYLFYQLMGEDLGGIEYTDDEALIPGRSFPENGNDEVEIIIGESKKFDVLSLEGGAKTAKKDENLNENLEDIGRMELEAAMVAKRINELMGKDGGERLTVEDNGTNRPIEYRDIVLLFRAPTAYSGVFFETLMRKGIPVALQAEKGYFEAVEIRTLISLLRVIDNPFNDIEFAAVLRGFFCGLDSNELALFALMRKRLSGEAKLTFYDMHRILVGESYKTGEKLLEKLGEELSGYKDTIYEKIIPKCCRLNDLIIELHKRQKNYRVGELITYIYNNTLYMNYVGMMPEGDRRLRNLDLLFQEVKAYDDKSYGSLSSFITYVDKLEKKEIDLDVESVTDFTDDAVRIMSIHKSKGLEFPVVFLSGMGKQFNLMDTKVPFIVHSDYHLGVKYRDPKKRCANEMLSRTAISARILTECIAEELRVFYVGLTRAKDKLIMTGVTPDIVELVKKYESIACREERKLRYSNVHTARSYLDFTVMAMIRNEAFCDAMKNVKKRMDKKGEQILSAEYQLQYKIEKPECRMSVTVYDFDSLAVEHRRNVMGEANSKNDDMEHWNQMPEVSRERIEQALSWNYENDVYAKQKSKLSVTEIKKMYEISSVSSEDKNNKNVYKKYVPPIPEFEAETKAFTASEKGTWVHKTMELLDFSGIGNEKQVEEFLEAMRRQGRLPIETKEFITADMIWQLISSDFGKRMCEAARRGELHKEKQFVIGVPVSRLYPDMMGRNALGDENKIVVQGIIDAYFKEGDKLILLDYKTDKISPKDEELLVKRYETQLLYYRDTLEQLTGLEVSETYIYSFALNKAIRLF